MSKTINATKARNEFFHLISWVTETKDTVLIKKDRKVVAKLEPINQIGNKEVKDALDSTFGILPDFPDVTRFRKSRSKALSL